MIPFKSAVILTMCLAFAGCSWMHSHAPIGKATVEDDIGLSTGDATLAKSLEKIKPLVDLTLEE